MADRAESEDRGGAYAQWLAVLLAVAAGLVRLVDHPFNFSSVGALGLFGGARLRSWRAFVLPLVVMVSSDLILWQVKGYTPFNRAVYASFLIYVLIGRLLTKKSSAVTIAGAAVLGSLQFFLVTNFAVWLGSCVDPSQLPTGATYVEVQAEGNTPYPVTHYARSASGLAACYLRALPFIQSEAPPFGFLGNCLAGDLFFTGILFGAQALLAGSALRRPVPAS